MRYLVCLLVCLLLCKIETITGTSTIVTGTNKARRILRGIEVGDSQPYMVYLRPAKGQDSKQVDPNWLCGGVIIHESYILTSAACIENVGHFYVVSGTHRWIPPGTKDDCITNGAMKAVWKCVPANYEFDGYQFENIRWMVNDIAVVKVEEQFNFERRVLGCDYSPKKIKFNNDSVQLEDAGTVGTVLGWGSQEGFADPIGLVGRQTINSPVLLETSTTLLGTDHCKKHWPDRYHYIIDKSMICAKDLVLNVDADKVNCKELFNTEEEVNIRRSEMDGKEEIHIASHYLDSRKHKIATGGFCENDHGGPLVVGQGKSATVVGVISACLANNMTRKCHGPFLFTSVYKNRLMVMCAIDKNSSPACRNLIFRTRSTLMNETTYSWIGHPDGPARSEVKKESIKYAVDEI